LRPTQSIQFHFHHFCSRSRFDRLRRGHERTKGPLLFGGDLALVQLSELPLIKLRNRWSQFYFTSSITSIAKLNGSALPRGGAPVDMAESKRQRDILELGEASERSTNEYLKQATGPRSVWDASARFRGDWGGKMRISASFTLGVIFWIAAIIGALTDWSLDEFASAITRRSNPDSGLSGRSWLDQRECR